MTLHLQIIDILKMTHTRKVITVHPSPIKFIIYSNIEAILLN